MSLTRIVSVGGLALLLLVSPLAPQSHGQGAGDKKRSFKVADTDDVSRKNVLAKSHSHKGQFEAFSDRNGDGIFDAVKIPDVQELKVDINVNEAQGFTYAKTGDTQREVVFYPARDIRIPKENEFLCYGFIHYFDEKELSNWFACVVYKVPGDEGAPVTGSKKASPYKADFIDRSGNRVGTPALLLLNTSAVASNPDFQRWQKASNEIILGYNPVAESRELFIFRKMPQIPDKVMMIFFRWF